MEYGLILVETLAAEEHDSEPNGLAITITIKESAYTASIAPSAVLNKLQCYNIVKSTLRRGSDDTPAADCQQAQF